MENQLKYLTHQDTIMLDQAARLLVEKSQNNTGKSRKKRFGLFSWVLGWGVYSNLRNIQAIKANVACLQEQNVLQEKQIIELAHYLNVTYSHVTTNRQVIHELQIKMATIEKTLLSTIGEIRYKKYVSLVLVDIQLNIAKLTLGILSLQENIGVIFKYMRVLSSRKLNPLIIPPDLLQQVLIHVKEDMKRNPRLSLPEHPNVNIWNYYTTIKITPIMMQDFLLVILTIPLIDQSLEMDLYKVYNLQALHPELKIQFKYE